MPPRVCSASESPLRKENIQEVLERADAACHDILINVDLKTCAGQIREAHPIPLSHIAHAVIRAGKWPQHVLHARRLPRGLGHVRHTTALIAVELTTNTNRQIAKLFGQADHSLVRKGSSAARKRLRDGDSHVANLFSASVLTLIQRHPNAFALLDPELQQVIRATIERHRDHGPIR